MLIPTLEEILEWSPLPTGLVDAKTPHARHLLIYLDGTEVAHATHSVMRANNEEGWVEFFVSRQTKASASGITVPNILLSKFEKQADGSMRRHVLTARAHGVVHYEWRKP